MSRTGYFSVDLKGYNITDDNGLDPLVIDKKEDGIYERIMSNYGKPILLTNFKIFDIERPSIYVNIVTTMVWAGGTNVIVFKLDYIDGEFSYKYLVVFESQYNDETKKYISGIMLTNEILKG